MTKHKIKVASSKKSSTTTYRVFYNGKEVAKRNTIREYAYVTLWANLDTDDFWAGYHSSYANTPIPSQPMGMTCLKTIGL
jgi:hypothetical protein